MGKIYTNSKYDSISFNRMYFILTITFLIIVNVFNTAAAQQKVIDIDSYLSDKKNAQEASEIQYLIYDVQPTVYLNGGTFTPKGDGPMKVASIGANDIGKLQEGHDSLRSVSLLFISFKDLQELQAFSLQPAHIGSMPNLAYVFFSLGFDVASAEIFSGIQGFDDSEIVFLFESARPF